MDRWACGDTNPVVAAVDSATVIEVGDLVYQDTDDAKPAGSLPKQWCRDGQSLEQAQQELFVKYFLGVAMQRRQSGDSDPIRVAITGVFEFDCPSGTFELGDLVGVVEASSGIALENQRVAPVAAGIYAIGRVAKRVATAAPTVLVDVRSTVMLGGV